MANLGEAKGKKDFFIRQAPQKLKALREHALVESAVSSNRIEGVKMCPGRLKALFMGKALPQDRDVECLGRGPGSLFIFPAKDRVIHNMRRDNHENNTA